MSFKASTPDLSNFESKFTISERSNSLPATDRRGADFDGFATSDIEKAIAASLQVFDNEMPNNTNGSGPAPSYRMTRKRAREEQEGDRDSAADAKRTKSPGKDDNRDDDDDYDPKKSKKNVKPPRKPASSAAISSSARRIKNLWHTPSRTLQSATESPLRHSKYDMYRLLLHPDSWRSLKREQKARLIGMLPNAAALGATVDTPDIARLLDLESNDAFRADCAKWQAALRQGYLDDAWLAKAAVASDRRAAGEFDEWEKRAWEETWGASSSSAPTPGSEPPGQDTSAA